MKAKKQRSKKFTVKTRVKAGFVLPDGTKRTLSFKAKEGATLR